MDAELAFLKSMQDGDADSNEAEHSTFEQRGVSVDQEDEEDYEPTNIIPAAIPHQSPDPPATQLTQKSPSPPTKSPSTHISPPAQAIAADSLSLPKKPSTIVPEVDISQNPEANVPAKQPRIIGGFIVDEEDEDEEEHSVTKSDVAASSSGQFVVDRGSSNTPQRSVATSANIPDPPVVLDSNATQDQEPSGVIPNGTANLVPNLATVVPSTGASDKDPPQPVTTLVQDSISSVAESSAVSSSKTRLPHDRVGMLEDRIKEDPRGDLDAWLGLINEYRKRNKLEEARITYDRFFKVFPSAAEQWVMYINMELDANDFWRVEQIFKRCLTSIPNVHLWSTYLDYVRRRNILSQDPNGNARQVVSQSYDFVLQNIGIDKDSGQIWQDYVQFIRSGPGQIGGNSWQDQQKMDLLRRTYQKAVCIPTQAVNILWKEYDAFEMGLNKVTGRKFLQEKSPAYMTARSSYTGLQNITRDLDRTTMPVLPPALGFEGDVEYTRQVEIWKAWIEWEKDDPLVIKEEDQISFRNRVLFVYKQAAMALRFWPEIWFEAAEFCFGHGLESEGNDFLKQGVNANPESCLLAFKRADRIETTTSNEEGEDSIKRRGDSVREPYDKVLDALYELINQAKQRESQHIARIKESFAQQTQASPGRTKHGDAEDEDDEKSASEGIASAQQAQIEAVQKGNAAQIKMLSRTVSFAWIALMRAMRRVQGKGKPNDTIGGSRQIFSDARKRGRLTSDVYIASALIEYHCYKDPAATKIFERGMRLFPEDDHFALEYLKHLIAINDITNARAVFEMTVNKIAQKPETMSKAKPIYAFFHQYESHYGELAQVSKLEKRMSDLFPEDPRLQVFSQRHSAPGFDPTMIRPIISPAAQARPKATPSVEISASVQNSPRPPHSLPVQITNSPKRPFEDSDNETNQRRKMPRAESPLKGAAGRRLDAQKRTQLRNEVNANTNATPTPAPSQPSLVRVLFLLGIIPPASLYNATIFNPEKLVNVIRNIDLTKADVSGPGGRAAPASLPSAPPQTYGYGQVGGPYGYGR